MKDRLLTAMSLRLAKIEVTEQLDVIHVSGPYVEMRDIYPKLKSKRFRYNGVSKSWWINKSKMSKEDVEKLVDELLNGSVVEKANRVIEENKKEELNTRKQNDFLAKCRSLKHCSVTADGRGFRVRHVPYGCMLADRLYALGGKSEKSNPHYDYVFPRPLDDYSKVYDAIDKFEGLCNDNYREAFRYDKEQIGKGSFTVDIIVGNSVVLMNCSRRDMSDVMRSEFPRASHDDMKWHIHICFTSGFDDSMEKIEKQLIKLENAEQEKLKEKAERDKGILPNGDRVLHLNTACWGCDYDSFRYQDEYKIDGELFHIIDVKKKGRYDGSDFFFDVTIRPFTELELAEREGKIRAIRNRSEAEKRLSDILSEVQKSGSFPSKLSPRGDKYISDRSRRLSIVGGGEWVYVDGDTVYAIFNNGGDGDFWGNNNVSTGGAGACGWVKKDADLAKEVLSLVDVADWKKE